MKLTRKGFFASLLAGPAAVKAVAEPKAEPVPDRFAVHLPAGGAAGFDWAGGLGAGAYAAIMAIDRSSITNVGYPLSGVRGERPVSVRSSALAQTVTLYGAQAQRFLDWWGKG